MVLSQSSRIQLDPLSSVLDVLDARLSRRTRLEAAGSWALAFPAIDRLKFVALLRGTQWMLIPGRTPLLMSEGDVCLLGRTPYVVACHPDEMPCDGQALYADGCDLARLGGADTVGVGGTVTLSPVSADFLLDMLPHFMIVPRSSPASGAVAKILALLNSELERDMMGSSIVSARLADVLLIEAIRAYAGQNGGVQTGWLGALCDVRIGRSLRAIHEDVSYPWTVAALAGVAGMSRAGFAAEFSRRVGQPPLTYLRKWRLLLAREALANGDVSVGSIAFKVGYRSQSAFGHAFRRAFGAAPKADK
jgi:AraC-like DNA-binding protein